MIQTIFVEINEFEAITKGKKLFIAAPDYDLPFYEGDILILNEAEVEGDIKTATGRSCAVYIDYLVRDRPWINGDCVIMSIKPCNISKNTMLFNMQIMTNKKENSTE